MECWIKGQDEVVGDEIVLLGAHFDSRGVSLFPFSSFLVGKHSEIGKEKSVRDGSAQEEILDNKKNFTPFVHLY